MLCYSLLSHRADWSHRGELHSQGHVVLNDTLLLVSLSATMRYAPDVIKPVYYPDTIFGAIGWIRTSTVHALNVTPPSSWATMANGRLGRICTGTFPFLRRTTPSVGLRGGKFVWAVG